MAVKDKVEIGAKLDPLSVGIVRRWLSSDSGLYGAITQYKHNHTYVSKLHRCTLFPHSLSLTHVMCNSNSYPVPSTVPLLPTEYRVERLYPSWVNVPVTCDPRGDLGWLLDHLAGTEGEHAICPLLSVKVNVAQELLRRQSWDRQVRV